MESTGASGHTEQSGYNAPEGYLDGSIFDIAHRLLDGYEADYNWQAEHSPIADLKLIALSRVAVQRQRARLQDGDEDLALSLTLRAQEQVLELQNGLRLVLPGQANLLGERAASKQKR